MLANAIGNVFSVAGTRDPLSGFWYNPVGAVSSTGIAINDHVALSVSTVFACIRVLSDALGVLPCHVYETDGEGGKDKASSHPFYVPLHSKPNIWQTPIDWKSMGVAHLGLRGNFYCELIPPKPDWPYLQMIPRNPDRIKVEQMPSGRLRYQHTTKDGRKRVLIDSEVLHIKLLCLDGDGIEGASPITYASNSIGLSKARHDHTAKMFRGGGFFKYFLKTSKSLGAQGRENFRASWRDIHGQGAAFTPPVLEDDMDIKTLGMSAEDMQTIESEKLSAIEICQYFGVPPHMVHLLENATYSNIEHQGIAFKTLHLAPWAVRFEQAIQRHFDDDENYYAEFLMDSLLRGDTASRYEAYTKGLGGNPFLSRNEVRAKENLPPVEGGDDIPNPLNMEVPGEAGKQNRDQPEAVEEPEERPDEPQATAINLRPVIQSTSQRIVARELQALKRKFSACKGDNQKWRTESHAWFDRHGEYVADAVLPLLLACGNDPTDCQRFADEYANESLLSLRTGNVNEVLDEWGTKKAAQLAEFIEETLQCTNES